MVTGEYHGYEIDSAGGYSCPICTQYVHNSELHVCTGDSGHQNVKFQQGTCTKCGNLVREDTWGTHVCTTSLDAITSILQEILRKLDTIETAIIMD